jgi:hypothetical protein
VSDIPLWLQVISAVATPVIAGLVGFIAWRQWRTAHTKILLDLFDRRLAAYEGLIDALRPAHRDGTIKSFDDFMKLRRAIDAAHFLFGDDVRVILKELVKIGAVMNTASGVMKNPGSQDYAQWSENNHKALLRLIEINDELPVLMENYLTFADKKLPTIWRRLSDKNKIRLSYADEKQK